MVTDYTAIPELTDHGLGGPAEVAARALNAGIDQDMVGESFLKYTAANIKSGAVNAAQLDAACRRVLEAKYRLGLFQDPYRNLSPERAARTLMKPEFVADARAVARKTLVLLKKGESRTLTFRLPPDALKFYNDDLKFVAEPGEFRVMVGGNSRDVQTATFRLVAGK